MKEYMVTIWGPAWNKDASPSIEKDLGIKNGVYYFTDEEEDKVREFLCTLSHLDPIYTSQGVVYSCKYGEMTHKRALLEATFSYLGNEYTIYHDFGYECDKDTVIHHLNGGILAGDDNRSRYIRRRYGPDAIPQLGPGSEIKLVVGNIHMLDQDVRLDADKNSWEAVWVQRS